MAITTSEILDVMLEHGVEPEDPPQALEQGDVDGPDLPGLGEVGEGETVYATSIDEVFASDDDGAKNTRAPR
jgi:hypothetical protein